MNFGGPQHRLRSNTPRRPRGPFATLIAFIIGAGLLALGLVFFLVLIAGIFAVGVSMYAYVWWKTRGLRKHLSEQMRSHPEGGAKEEGSGDVIEGVVIVHEEQGKSDKGESK